MGENDLLYSSTVYNLKLCTLTICYFLLSKVISELKKKKKFINVWSLKVFSCWRLSFVVDLEATIALPASRPGLRASGLNGLILGITQSGEDGDPAGFSLPPATHLSGWG